MRSCPELLCNKWRSPVVVFDTVDLIFSVHSEGHSIKALITDDTAETAGVVRLPEGLQDLWREKWVKKSRTSILLFPSAIAISCFLTSCIQQK